MVTTKPIKVDDEVKKKLDDIKKYPRETYNDTLRRMLKLKVKIETRLMPSYLKRMVKRKEKLNTHLSKLRRLKKENNENIRNM